MSKLGVGSSSPNIIRTQYIGNGHFIQVSSIMTQKAKKEPENPDTRNAKAKGRSSMNPKCQKCLEQGHWTYQCRGRRKIVSRSTRAALLRKRMKAQEAASQGRLWEFLRAKAMRNARQRLARSSSESISSSAMSESASYISISSDSSSTSSSSKESTCDSSSSSSYKDYSESEPEVELELEEE